MKTLTEHIFNCIDKYRHDFKREPDDITMTWDGVEQLKQEKNHTYPVFDHNPQTNESKIFGIKIKIKRKNNI